MLDAWKSVREGLPEDGESVLAVKQCKDGSRSLCFARCFHNYRMFNIETREYYTGTYWSCGGNNNIIYWMPLPEMPKE